MLKGELLGRQKKCVRSGSLHTSSAKSLLDSLVSVLRTQFKSQKKDSIMCPAIGDGPRESKGSRTQRKTYAHCGIDLGHCLFICWELVDLDAVADQLTHDFTLELVQLIFCNGVSLGNDGDDVHLQDKDSTAHVAPCEEYRAARARILQQ